MITRTPGRRNGRRPAAGMLAQLIDEAADRYSLGAIAKYLGVSLRSVWGWRRGEHEPSEENMQKLLDILLSPHSGFLPIYCPAMALDGHTRVGGVSEYSCRAARGDHEYLCRYSEDDDSESDAADYALEQLFRKEPTKCSA